MNILYTRIFTLEQKNDRQVQNAKDYDFVIEDKCSGATPFFERDGEKLIEYELVLSYTKKFRKHCIKNG
jgi:DNA invertase Pin-like site-specific DNA recombinase